MLAVELGDDGDLGKREFLRRVCFDIIKVYALDMMKTYTLLWLLPHQLRKIENKSEARVTTT